MVIKISISNKIAAAEGTPVIVCGNSDYSIQFAFDEEWGADTYKTARFVYIQGGEVKHQDADFTGNTVKVPTLYDIREVRVGVFEGERHTSTPAVIPCKLSVICGSGAPAIPTPQQDARIMELLNLAIEQTAAANTCPAIVCEVSGEAVSAHDAADWAFHGLSIYGKTTQNGTPTPDAPVALVSAGDGGSIGVKVTGKNLLGFYDFEPITPTYRTYSCNNGVISVEFNAALSTTAILQNVTFAYLNNDRFGCGTYVFSITHEGGSPKYPSPRVQITMDDGSVVEGHNGVPFTLTQSGKITGILCDTVSPASGTVYAFRLQIEQGTAQTDWEQPVTVQSLTLPTPNGLPGIPVQKNGNYTDSNGQQWVCDEIDLVRGVYVQRVDKYIYDGTYRSIGTHSNGQKYCSFQLPGVAESTLFGNGVKVLSDRYKAWHWTDTDNGVYLSGGALVICDSRFVDSTTAGSILREEQAVFLHILKTPIETPLDAETLTAYAALHTNKPNTTVLNNAGAGMAVEYVADTKLYIDNKFSAMAAALVNS